MKKVSFSLLICLALLLVFPVSALAHPADMYYHTHTVTLSPEGIFITWQIVPGPMIAQSIWFDVDKDQDDLVSDIEAADWVNSILMTFSVDISEESLSLELESVDWPSTVDTLFSGEEPIIIYLFAEWPEEFQADVLVSLHNRYNPKSSLSWFEIQTEGGLSFEIPNQNSGNLDFLVGIEAGDDETARLTGWESGSPTIPWVVESIGLGGLAEEAAAESQISPAAGSGPASILEGLIKKARKLIYFYPERFISGCSIGCAACPESGTWKNDCSCLPGWLAGKSLSRYCPGWNCHSCSYRFCIFIRYIDLNRVSLFSGSGCLSSFRVGLRVVDFCAWYRLALSPIKALVPGFPEETQSEEN